MPNADTRAPRELRRIAQDLRRMYRGPAWHGPSVRESLEGVSAQMAVVRVQPETHTIYELAHHIGAWIGETNSRLQGKSPGEPVEGDFPALTTALDDAQWQSVLQRLDAHHDALHSTILAFDAARLDDAVGGPNAGESQTTYLTMLHGAISHDAYHAGQIVLLRKSLG